MQKPIEKIVKKMYIIRTQKRKVFLGVKGISKALESAAIIKKAFIGNNKFENIKLSFI